jgi:hypothetical protein
MRALSMEEFEAIKDRHPTPSRLVNEKKCYLETGLLFPPLTLLEREEPRLKSLITKFQRTDGSRKVAAEIRKYVDSKWQPNVTLVDLEYTNSHFDKPSINHDPFIVLAEQAPRAEPPQHATQLYDYAFTSFTDVSKAISQLKSRFAIEFISAELTKAMEQIRHGTLQHREGRALNDLKVAKFPQRYDRIHLSNIPSVSHTEGEPIT